MRIPDRWQPQANAPPGSRGSPLRSTAGELADPCCEAPVRQLLSVDPRRSERLHAVVLQVSGSLEPVAPALRHPLQDASGGDRTAPAGGSRGMGGGGMGGGGGVDDAQRRSRELAVAAARERYKERQRQRSAS